MEVKTSYEVPESEPKYEYVIQSTITVSVKANSKEDALARYHDHDFASVRKWNIDVIGKLNNTEKESD